MCFFQSHFLWPKKNLTVPDSPNFIFPLWEPHSRIIFLSQTNELQRVHYVAASKQEAGVSDGKAWFYIMKDAWGCAHRPARCRQSPAGFAPSNPGWRLCSAWPATPSDLDDQAPFPGEVLASLLVQGLLVDFPGPLRIDTAMESVPKDTPHSLTLRVAPTRASLPPGPT